MRHRTMSYNGQYVRPDDRANLADQYFIFRNKDLPKVQRQVAGLRLGVLQAKAGVQLVASHQLPQ